MKRILGVTCSAALLALLATPVSGQGQAGTPAAQKEPSRPMSAQRARSGGGADARHCLKLATNMEIHRCAEKYRPR
jgi:hypothetical protein